MALQNDYYRHVRRTSLFRVISFFWLMINLFSLSTLLSSSSRSLCPFSCDAFKFSTNGGVLQRNLSRQAFGRDILTGHGERQPQQQQHHHRMQGASATRGVVREETTSILSHHNRRRFSTLYNAASSSSNVGNYTKTNKTNMQSIVDTSTILGVVDPESNIIGSIEVLDNEPCDCMLVLIDPPKLMDKFYILQLIHDTVHDKYVVYTRWGRTGTRGKGQLSQFERKDEAATAFQKKFKQKTGLQWKDRNGPTLVGKYRVIQQNFVEKKKGYKSAKWQYWVDDGVDGKTTGWYDYTQVGSIHVEQLYQENLYNSKLTNRLVKSGTFTYDVDLKSMIQTNVVHPNRKSRQIRRYYIEVTV